VNRRVHRKDDAEEADAGLHPNKVPDTLTAFTIS
jgi:hypothetical protein